MYVHIGQLIINFPDKFICGSARGSCKWTNNFSIRDSLFGRDG